MGLFLLLVLLHVLLTNQTDTLDTHLKNEEDPMIYRSDTKDGVHLERYLVSIELSDLPDILLKSCALVGIPPYSSQPQLGSVLLELSEIFQDESTVFIGQFLHLSAPANTTDSVLSDHRSKISWKIPSKENDKTCLVFYEREPKDRTCLLNPPRTTFYAVPYTGQINVEILVQYINEKCSVFRTSLGTLTHEGLFHQHLLSNLYRPKNPVEECIEIQSMPTRMEFFQEYLFRSKPVVIKNALKKSLVMKKWTSNYLRELYGRKRIHIKLTEDGIFEGVESAKLWSGYREDRIPDKVKSQLKYPDIVVVRPATSEMLFSDFLDLISSRLTWNTLLFPTTCQS